MSRIYIFLRGLSLWQISDLGMPTERLGRLRGGVGNLQFKKYKTAKFPVNSEPISVENASFPGRIRETWLGIAMEMNPCENACFLDKMTKLRSKALASRQLSLWKTPDGGPQRGQTGR